MEKLPKNNYFKMGEDILKNLDKPSRVLLHSCCAPCSSACIEYLTKYVDVTVLYYNPNIEPYEEYLKRKEEQKKFLKVFPSPNPLNFLDCDYENEEFKKLALGLEKEKEGGPRCFICYRLRLERAAKYAAAHGFDWFCTTLSISPLKNCEKLNQIGMELAAEYGVPFLPSDFKKREGYKRSIELSHEYSLYRQNYCGCVFSKPKSTE